MSDIVDKLKELLEGAKVIEVLESDRSESVCELCVEKEGRKYSFTLFATDLGSWVDGLKKSDGSLANVQDLIEGAFEHCSAHTENRSDLYESFDEPLKQSFGFRCKECGKEFRVSMTTVKNSEYFELFTTPEKRRVFAKLLTGYYIQNKEAALECIAAMNEGT